MDLYYMNYKKENDGLRSLNEDMKIKISSLQEELAPFKNNNDISVQKSTGRNNKSGFYKDCGDRSNYNDKFYHQSPDKSCQDRYQQNRQDNQYRLDKEERQERLENMKKSDLRHEYTTD